MSLISQNARPKNEAKREDDIKEKESEDVDALKVKKRKRGGKGQQQGIMRMEWKAGTTAKASDLFFTDRPADTVLSVYQEDADLPDESDDALQRKPVWVDEEEEKTTVNIAKVNRLRKLRKEEDENLISASEYVSRLRAQYVKLNPGTDWAQLDSRLMANGIPKFRASSLKIAPFVKHLSCPMGLREEKSLEVFEVSSDSQLIAFVGNEGYILLVSTKTKQLVGTLKMNGTIRSSAFAEDGQKLLSAGGDGQVYHWDLRTRTCIHKGVDEGCINSTALCTSPGGTHFAAGSDSGIVNIYNREEFLGGKRKPIKTIENLTTKVDFMRYNHDSQILAICSTMKKSSLKLIHIPSYIVFSNWPPSNTSLHYPRCIDCSPGGGFMVVGNASGKVLLYKLHHYQHA
ncbi:WD40/YVTN repeat-like-containing domain superfamily [Sesbania bispinosa]|nr:WD40/YVTN repeat-like-containing domain superfamily [Sesbania bispinosa]